MQPTQNTVIDPIEVAVTTPTVSPSVSPSWAAIERQTPAGVLRAAAGYLHQYGWFQGDLFDDPDRSTPCACPVGAIRMAVIGTPEVAAEHLRGDVLAQFDAAVAVLADHLISEYDALAPVAPHGVLFPGDLEQVVARWNDHPDRNVGQVLAALYGAADEWDRIDARRGSCGCKPDEHSDECCIEGTCTCTADVGGAEVDDDRPGTPYDCPICEGRCYFYGGQSYCCEDFQCVHCASLAEQAARPGAPTIQGVTR